MQIFYTARILETATFTALFTLSVDTQWQIPVTFASYSPVAKPGPAS
jgi:hypothetical protein